ncbi:MAG: hypothetical protein Alpg2KO_31950 [Alphaproteobacteria bacterium]
MGKMSDKIDVRAVGQQNLLINVAGDVSQGLTMIDLSSPLHLGVASLEGGKAALQQTMPDGTKTELGCFSSADRANAALTEIGERIAHLPSPSQSSFEITPRRLVVGAVLASLAVSVISVMGARSVAPAIIPAAAPSEMAINLEIPEDLATRLASIPVQASAPTNVQVSLDIPPELLASLTVLGQSVKRQEVLAETSNQNTNDMQELMGLMALHGPDRKIIQRENGETVLLPTEEERTAFLERVQENTGSDVTVSTDIEAMISGVATGEIRPDGVPDIDAKLATTEEGLAASLFRTTPDPSAEDTEDFRNMMDNAGFIPTVEEAAKMPAQDAVTSDAPAAPARGGRAENRQIIEELIERSYQLESDRRAFNQRKRQQVRELMATKLSEQLDLPQEPSTLDAFGLQ